jgi:hypothetical protein
MKNLVYHPFPKHNLSIVLHVKQFHNPYSKNQSRAVILIDPFLERLTPSTPTTMSTTPKTSSLKNNLPITKKKTSIETTRRHLKLNPTQDIKEESQTQYSTTQTTILKTQTSLKINKTKIFPIPVQKQTYPMSWLEGLGTVFLVLLGGSLLLALVIFLRNWRQQHTRRDSTPQEVIGEQIPLQGFLQSEQQGQENQGQETQGEPSQSEAVNQEPSDGFQEVQL